MNEDTRLLSGEEIPEDNFFGHEKSSFKLRPQTLDQFFGQKKVVQNIELMMKSANLRQRALDHILLVGPPGLGKTSLAMIVANSLNKKFHSVIGPAIEKKGDLAAILSSIGPQDVIFIDEIHRMPIAVEEILYSAMEDFRLDIIIGQGQTARTLSIDLPEFCLIGATTKSGLLSAPLRDRFLGQFHFDFYTIEELMELIGHNAAGFNLKISQSAIRELAVRSRGTPRIANRILRRIRDYVLVNNIDELNLEHINRALGLLGIDSCGLDGMDRKILDAINKQFSGGPVGIEALSATLGEDKYTLESVYEPYLLKSGYLARTPRGRILLDKGLEYIKNMDFL